MPITQAQTSSPPRHTSLVASIVRLLYSNIFSVPQFFNSEAQTLHPGISGSSWSGSSQLLQLWSQDSGCRVVVLFPQIPHSFSFLSFSCSCPHLQWQQFYSHLTSSTCPTQCLCIFFPLFPALRKMSLMAKTELPLFSEKRFMVFRSLCNIITLWSICLGHNSYLMNLSFNLSELWFYHIENGGNSSSFR